MRRSTVLLVSIIAVAVLYGASTAAIGTTPEATDSGAEVVAWLRDHAGNIHAGWLCTTFAMVFFAIFAAIVKSALPKPYGDVFLIGAVVLIVETVVSGWFWLGLALHPNQLEPATARTLLDVAIYWGPLLTGATITMLAPIAVLSFQRRAGLAPWLGVVAVVAIVEQAVETVTIFGDSGFIAPGGPMNLMLGAGLVTIAFVCIGVTISRSLARDGS